MTRSPNEIKELVHALARTNRGWGVVSVGASSAKHTAISEFTQSSSPVRNLKSVFFVVECSKFAIVWLSIDEGCTLAFEGGGGMISELHRDSV